MKRIKIEKFPYKGKIIHIEEGEGMEDDKTQVVYEGCMDLYLERNTLDNNVEGAKYIIYTPYINHTKLKPFTAKDESGSDTILAINHAERTEVLGCSEKQIYLPQNGDKIEIHFYDDVQYFLVSNSVFSQLDGIEIYVTKTTWSNGGL